jgi:hypothetical protein
MDVRTFLLWTFGLGCLTRFVAPGLFVPGFFEGVTNDLMIVSHLPTTHISTFMLGGLIAIAHTRREKAEALVLLVLYSALSGFLFKWNTGGMILIGGLLMLLTPRLIAPRPLTTLILTLSSASLFIYLTHFVTRSALRMADAPEWPALHVAAGLAVGVLVWMVWTRGSSLVARRLHRSNTETAAI